MGEAVNKEEIISMAREAGYSGIAGTTVFSDSHAALLVRFAALIAAHEREECVKVCEKIELNNLEFTNKSIV